MYLYLILFSFTIHLHLCGNSGGNKRSFESDNLENSFAPVGSDKRDYHNPFGQTDVGDEDVEAGRPSGQKRLENSMDII